VFQDANPIAVLMEIVRPYSISPITIGTSSSHNIAPVSDVRLFNVLIALFEKSGLRRFKISRSCGAMQFCL